MKIVIGRMKKRLDGMGFPGSRKAASEPPAASKKGDGEDSLDDLFGDAPDASDDSEQEPDGDEGAGGSADLENASDEDLLKEIKKRGLSPAGGQALGRMRSGADDADDDSDF